MRPAARSIESKSLFKPGVPWHVAEEALSRSRAGAALPSIRN